MIELLVIKYLLNIDNYNKYRHYIKIKDNKELEEMYDILDSMIKSYQRTISFDEYQVTVLQYKPQLDYWIDRLKESAVGEDVVTDLIKKIQEKQWSHELALLSIDVTEGRREIDAILDHVSKIEAKTEVSETTFITDDLEELYDTTVSSPGLRWRLNSLNKSLGSLRKGDFGFIFARPETGKTTFLASETTFMASQLADDAGPILWINNEEQSDKVMIRCHQAVGGVDLAALYSNRAKFNKLFQEQTKGKLKIIKDLSIVHKSFVEKLCVRYRPSLIIFDQIDKIVGFDSDREDLRLGAIYQWARELAKKYAPVIAVCQADGTGEGVRWLTMKIGRAHV